MLFTYRLSTFSSSLPDICLDRGVVVARENQLLVLIGRTLNVPSSSCCAAAAAVLSDGLSDTMASDALRQNFFLSVSSSIFIILPHSFRVRVSAVCLPLFGAKNFFPSPFALQFLLVDT